MRRQGRGAKKIASHFLEADDEKEEKKEEDDDTPYGTPRSLVLHASGGMGKTTVALSYAYAYFPATYQEAWSINASNKLIAMSEHKRYCTKARQEDYPRHQRCRISCILACTPRQTKKPLAAYMGQCRQPSTCTRRYKPSYAHQQG